MTVLGLGPTIANLNRIGVQMIEASGDGVEAAADRVRDAWVNNIESEGLVDTGRYRDSVTVRREGDEAAAVSDVEYAPFLEFGTSNIRAYHVAERAADESHDAVLDAVGRKVGGVL